ncbi:MAG TPA: hypothetical protein VFS19_00750 [Planctomycetota bacterium]|nr:hypothetical protein [Planctomycetota bacterium]
MSDPKLLHVYWLDAKGGECFIVGNRAGLLVLRHAIQTAIEKGRTVGEQVTAADNEPYKVTVILEGSPLTSDSWQRMALPYVAEGAVDVRENALWPSELWMMKERA